MSFILNIVPCTQLTCPPKITSIARLLVFYEGISMPGVLDDSIISAVANANFKSVSELGVLNALGHAKRLDLIAESSLGQILDRMNSLDPTEAAAISGVVTSDLSEKIGELSGAVASAQQMMKGAQTTLPQTGQGG